MDKIVNGFTVLAEQYPGVLNIPLILVILLFAVAVFSFGSRGNRSFRPKRFRQLLATCLKLGCYLMIFCCLWGCFLLGSQTSLAKQRRPLNPLLEVAVGLSWLMVVVPCLLAEKPGKPVKSGVQ
jgi:putative copper export protein